VAVQVVHHAHLAQAVAVQVVIALAHPLLYQHLLL
jgi:hypothetical protein